MDDKQIIAELLAGGYLRKTINARGKRILKLCSAEHHPLGYLYKSPKRLKEVLHVKKRDLADGKLTLNLVAVRQLHGKSFIKKMYKDARAKKSATQRSGTRPESAA